MKKDRIKPTGSGRRLSYSTETDERLLHWVKKFQENKVNVTREMLQKQALSLIQPECPEFKASSGWVEKFLVRHGLTLPGMSRSFSKGAFNCLFLNVNAFCLIVLKAPLGTTIGGVLGVWTSTLFLLENKNLFSYNILKVLIAFLLILSA